MPARLPATEAPKTKTRSTHSKSSQFKSISGPRNAAHSGGSRESARVTSVGGLAFISKHVFICYSTGLILVGISSLWQAYMSTGAKG